MNEEAQQELSSMLQFLNQCPFGLLKTDKAGNILLLNAAGSQLLIPVSMEAKKGLGNILVIMDAIDPELRPIIESYKPEYGQICKNRRVRIDFQSVDMVQYLAFTIIRISPEVYQYSINDITKVVESEYRLNEAIESQAVQAGKLEMSTGILHDIGNAVTAFGSEVAKFSGDLDWRELSDLQKLISLFAAKEQELEIALGPGKGQALSKFLAALITSLSNRQKDYQQIARQLAETTSHVQEILNIQRHYAKGKTKGERAPIYLRNVIEDSLAMQERGLEKRGIQVRKDLPLNLPPIKGDKTKLIQVMINLFKNAGEAFDELTDERQKTLLIRLSESQEDKMICLIIEDNAIGFEEGKGEAFFEKGITSKDTGSGFGLHNCRQIIETHQGQISLTSRGPGLGSTITLRLPYVVEEPASLKATTH